MKVLLRFIFVFVAAACSAQSNPDEKLWSNLSEISAADYYITTTDTQSPVKSQISISWQLMGFSVLNKNFNKNVTNKFIRSASIYNPDIANKQEILEYQQINFNMAEVYARKMRKDLFIHKSKLWKGFEYASHILNEHLNEFYKVQLLMERDTMGGSDPEKVKKWKSLIVTELNNTRQFDYNYTDKIIIDKAAESTVTKTWL